MEKITKEELMKMAQLTDEELESIAAGLGFDNSCIGQCSQKVPLGIRACNNGARINDGAIDEDMYRYCYDRLMESFEFCKSKCY